MKRFKHISFFILVLSATTVCSQQKDFTGLSGITLSKNISRAWDVSLGTQAMFNQNLHELWFAFLDGSVGFRIKRNLNTELHVRAIQFRQLDNTYSQRNLFYHTLTWSKSLGRWGVGLRNRVQQLVYGEHFNDGFKGPVWYNRNRVAIRYRINYFWSPYISMEGLVPLNHVRRKGFDQYRIATGVSYTRNDFVRFDIFYQIQQQLQRSAGNSTFFVIGFNTSIKIP